jgi:hypothetical protein
MYNTKEKEGEKEGKLRRDLQINFWAWLFE